MTGTSGHVRSTHVGIRARHLAADIGLSECEIPLKANGPVLINQWTYGYMTVYLQDANYTGQCEGSHRKEHKKRISQIQKYHFYSVNYGTKYMPYSCDKNKTRSLQTANTSYGHMPCRETKTARVESIQVISLLS